MRNCKTNKCRLAVSRRIDWFLSLDLFKKEPQMIGQPDADKAAVFGRSWFLGSLNVSRSSGRLVRAGYLWRSAEKLKELGQPAPL